MKKTMLTYRTLDCFENEFVVDGYTSSEIKEIEFSAYIANMNRCNHPEWTDADVFNDFLRVLVIENIQVTMK